MNLLTLNEAAAKISVRVNTLYKWIATGQLAALRRGRQWFVDQETLAKFRPRPVGNPNFGKDFWKNRTRSRKSA